MDLVLSLTSSVVTALVTAYLTTRKIREDMEAKYDTDLRDRRLKVYAELWASLEPLAKYAPPGPVTPRTLADLSRSLCAWYFRAGGLFLSEPARDAYFALQDSLVAHEKADGPDAHRALDHTAFEAVRGRGSLLRTQLASDIGTRRRLMLASE